MVFSSVPVYLDPSNWQQHNQSAAAVGSENHQLPLHPPPPGSGGGGSGGNMSSIRPGSMAERARLAKIPQPETALKCPRCDSTNTKFCYFNNYSLTQPRHFCKTCRRYWTRGGALRNVPVGGGCRRNKRSKGNNNNNNNRSKSPTKAGSTSSNGLVTCTTDNITGHIIPPPSHLPILPSLHHLNNYNSTDIGLNFGGIQPPVAATAGGGMEFHQIGSTSSANGGGGGGGGGSFLSNGLVDQWRLQQVQQQFPFLSNIEASNGLYQFENEGINYGDQGRSNNKALESNNVKMEEMNLSKNFLGISGNDHHHYWSGNNAAWTDLSGFTSSSTTHLL